MLTSHVEALPSLMLTAASAAVVASLVTASLMRRRHSTAHPKGAPPDPASFHLIPAMRSRLDHTDPTPRSGYLSWDDYFMAIAFLSAQRSKDPNKQVGACIVSSDHVILGIGYNGFPRGCCDSKLPWAKVAPSGNPLDTKYPYVCHAEMNALLNKNAACVDGAVRPVCFTPLYPTPTQRVYVTMFPCNECAKLLIQAGIKEIVYSESKSGSHKHVASMLPDQAYEASRRLLALAGVRTRQHTWQRPLMLCFR